MNNSAVLWTGGKDCALAFHKSSIAGYQINYLVTFAPKNPNFLAHSLELIKMQTESIGIPHLIIEVEAPMNESYENGIALLKEDYKIDALITGDIDEIEGHSNWIVACSKKSQMAVFNPLWKKNREELLKELIQQKFQVIFTLVKKSFFDSQWLEKELNKNTLQELKEKLNIDICGENGEYHTMVLNAPFFKKKLVIDSYKKKEREHFYFSQIQRIKAIDN